MHILVIAPAIADYCVEYANAIARNVHVTLVAPRRDFADHADFVDGAVDLRLLDWPRHRSLKNIWFMLNLRRLIDKLKPDVVHVMSSNILWLYSILPVAKKYGLVTTIHDVNYHIGDRASRQLPRFFGAQLIRQSTHLIVHGATLSKAAVKMYPSVKNRLSVVPHITLSRYKHLSSVLSLNKRDTAAFNILFFGRIYPYKGLDILIKSIPLVTHVYPNVNVVIAGEGENILSYRRKITDEQFFEIRNYQIKDREAAQLFVDADVVVLPYLEASQSGVLAIANAFAKPLIVTNVGELGETVRDGISGLVVPPADERSLADAILKLATNAALRRRLGDTGRALAIQNASPEIVAEKAVEIYTRVADAGKRRRRARSM